MTYRPRHTIQRRIRHDKRIRDQARLVLDRVRVAHSRQHLHAEDFLDRVLEFTKATVCPVSMFITQTPPQRSASGRSAMAMSLKKALSRTCDRPMQGQRTAKVQTAGNAGPPGQCLVFSRGEFDAA
jgi:hypothetical protein